jgi:hypothetical protein
MKQLIILLGVFLVAIIGCGHTIRNAPMLQDQAELIRSNWENLKMGMSIEEVKNLFGPATVYRTQMCHCDECAPVGAVNQKIEKLWYVYQSVKDPNIYIYLAFRHGRLIAGWAETMAGAILLK